MGHRHPGEPLLARRPRRPGAPRIAVARPERTRHPPVNARACAITAALAPAAGESGARAEAVENTDESRVVLRRVGNALARLFGKDSEAARAARLPADPVARH